MSWRESHWLQSSLNTLTAGRTEFLVRWHHAREALLYWFGVELVSESQTCSLPRINTFDCASLWKHCDFLYCPWFIIGLSKSCFALCYVNKASSQCCWNTGFHYARQRKGWWCFMIFSKHHRWVFWNTKWKIRASSIKMFLELISPTRTWKLFFTYCMWRVFTAK